jgi:hypothetical protein
VPQLLRLNPEKLKIDLAEVKPPRLTVFPLKRSGLAMISVWDNLADRAEHWQTEMAGIGSNVAGYKVTESMPVALFYICIDPIFALFYIQVVFQISLSNFSHTLPEF